MNFNHHVLVRMFIYVVNSKLCLHMCGYKIKSLLEISRTAMLTRGIFLVLCVIYVFCLLHQLNINDCS